MFDRISQLLMLITVHRTLFYNFISSFHYQKLVVQLKGPKKGNQTGKKKKESSGACRHPILYTTHTKGYL
jgi:hypothetical protein